MNYPQTPRTKENIVECKVINVTPALAAHYLSNNPSNRRIAPSRVSSFASMMEAGQWVVNGETIVVSATGRLLDGQHRLSAVIEYGRAVPMLIATGAADSTFSTIDIGAKRTASHIFTMSDIPYAAATAAAAAILYKLFHNVMATHSVPTPYLLELVRRYPQISQWAPKAERSKNIIATAPLLAACVYLDAIAHTPQLAAELVEGLQTGENLSRGNPVLALRNRSLNMRAMRTNATNGGRVIWPAIVRSIDAMEANALLMVAKGQPIKTAVLRPARFLSHARQLTPEQRLIDLPPNASRSAPLELVAAE